MKVNLLIGFLVLNLLALNCASTDIDPPDSDRGFGLKYIYKQKKLDYALKRKEYGERNAQVSGWALYFDVAFYPINVVYLPLKGKLLFSEMNTDGEVVREVDKELYEAEMLALEEKIKEDDKTLFDNRKEKNILLQVLDYVILPFNVYYYAFTNKSIFGTVDNTEIEGYDELEIKRVSGSVREKRARTYLRKLAVLNEHQRSPFELDPYLEKLYPNVNGEQVYSKLSYSADRIMEYTNPEDFEDALEDAGWDVEDLELSESEIQELKENGYLVSNETPSPNVKK